MKIEMAIYTAQEGYSWQPGTTLSQQALREFKECIGKFPSPDSDDFPFGGIFLLRDSVVFYRYHVAKKIDFRGRDALYCALGVLPRDKVCEVDPGALFSLPQFAAPAQPFPTSAELDGAEASAVPEWLKNLDWMTLDVKVSANSEGGLEYEVKQEEVVPPTPAPKVEDDEKPVGIGTKEPASVHREPTRSQPQPAATPRENANANVAEGNPALPKLSKLEKYLLVAVVIGALVAAVLFGVGYVLGSRRGAAEKNKSTCEAAVEKAAGGEISSPALVQVQTASVKTNGTTRGVQ